MRRPIEVSANNLKDQVVSIQRVTKVVKGGKNLSFSALVVVGDQRGHAGFGMGKAREVPMAIRKAIEQAKKNLIRLNLKGAACLIRPSLPICAALRLTGATLTPLSMRLP